MPAAVVVIRQIRGVVMEVERRGEGRRPCTREFWRILVVFVDVTGAAPRKQVANVIWACEEVLASVTGKESVNGEGKRTLQGVTELSADLCCSWRVST